ncbi:hypothetical protein F5141DRAFT_1210367 [Pisolithus sp. B1]|nr:hypothetical protein F5141DRAFT_1210367 [Pisolithus sp. B1]
MTWHHDAKAQKMHEHAHHCQLAEEGSENDTNEELTKEDDPSDIDDEDTQPCVVTTKLGEATNEQLTYHNGKVPKPLHAIVPSVDHETCGETVTTDDELGEKPHWTSQATSQTPSNCQLSKHKRSKERDYMTSDHQLGKQKKHKGVHIDHRTPKLEDTACVTYHQAAKEDIAPATVKAQKLTENDGHPHTRDYDDVTQEFMAMVIREYHTCLCAQAPMPDHTQETSLLSASWVRGCQVTTVNLTHTPQLMKLVTIQGSQVWGQLKTKLWPLIEAAYGFYSSQSKSAIKKNQALAEDLKEGMNFAFKEDGWHRFLKAPLIQKIINMMWFANKHDDGVTFADHFNPFPYPVLALVLTAIECCIDKWTMGTWMDIAFTIQEYHSMFGSHLNCLQEFKEAMKEFRVLPGIHKKHMRSDGATPLIVQSQSTVSARVIADAIKGYQEGSTTDDESD